MLDKDGNVLINNTRLTNDADRSMLPKIEVDSYGYVHIVWRDERNGQNLWYTKLVPMAHPQDGSSANEADILLIDDMQINSGVWPQELDITIDSMNNIHIIFRKEINKIINATIIITGKKSESLRY